ncbi:LOW QUALITY PROTEIN: 3 beta-hydroxysteroid dehydrogenase type 7 [Stegostoma tigrinum]|uniref:LOW QUALITY PROTEIN: 3 beta-hydroxysteroid dehydrogenase type 7 n=1 Tax=Stegostoma tigrinum TaxID=3053191 RepID=UPI002870070E|nr:LOW QUALITY PROTEIN: 3 beta-hydroxysteroid dehydrogenase type 7 [Stegostoma tigrinum]
MGRRVCVRDSGREGGTVSSFWPFISAPAIRAGTQNVLQACKDLGVRYLVYTSSMEVVGPNMNGDHFIRGDEDTPYNICPEGPYACSKAEAEQLVLRANGMKVAGGMTLHTCALRPTGIYGEGNPVMENMYHQLVKFGRRRLRLARKEVEHGRVYVGNVAWMHLLAARGLQARPGLVGGEAYFCYDDSPYLSYEEFDMHFLGDSGFRMVGMGQAPLPFFALYLLALLSQWACRILRPLLGFQNFLNVYTLRMITSTFTVSTDKAGRHFGYSPIVSWAESRDRTRAWVRQLGAAPPQRE